MDNTIALQMEWKNYFYLDLLDDIFLFFGLRWVFLAACRPFCVAESGGYSLVAVCRLLLALSSLVAEQRL